MGVIKPAWVAVYPLLSSLRTDQHDQDQGDDEQKNREDPYFSVIPRNGEFTAILAPDYTHFRGILRWRDHIRSVHVSPEALGLRS